MGYFNAEIFSQGKALDESAREHSPLCDRAVEEEERSMAEKDQVKRGYSSAGRALGLHPRGLRFDPA